MPTLVRHFGILDEFYEARETRGVRKRNALFVEALSRIRVRRLPVVGEVEAPGDTYAGLLLQIVEQPPQAGGAAGMADQAHVHADRHHLRARGAFLVEDVEGVLDQAEPVVGMAHGGGVLAVIVGERVGHDQLRLALDGLPERQLVAVIVAVVGEAAFLDQQAAGVDAGSIAAIPAGRPRAHGLLQRRHRLGDVLALLGLAQLEMLHPAPAVAADVEARFPDRLGGERVALERQRAAEHRHRQAALLEGAHQAPEADAAAVLEHAFAREVAALHAHRGAGGLGEAGLGKTLAILQGGLGAFLVVHDEVDGDARAVRPFGIGRGRAIAQKVACRLPMFLRTHVGLLTSSAPIWRAMSAILSLDGLIEIVFTPARRQASAWPGASPQSTTRVKSTSANSWRARSCRAAR